MIIIYISQRAWRPSNRQTNQIISASIVLIDLHQLNVKTTSGNTNQRHWMRQPHINEEQNPQNNNRNIRFPNQMIEQINIALEQKGPKNFSF